MSAVGDDGAVWREHPLAQIELLVRMEQFPPFGKERERNIANITDAVNQSGVYQTKLTRKEVEAKIELFVNTKHEAFNGVDSSEFTHPDFVALHGGEAEYDVNKLKGVTPKAKRARSEASTQPSLAVSACEAANAGLRNSSNLLMRMRKFERSWQRCLNSGEKLKEFSKLVYGGIATQPSRTATTTQIVEFVVRELTDKMIQAEADRFVSKNDAELRERIYNTLANNAVFFSEPDANGDGSSAGPMADSSCWSVGDLAVLELEGDDDE